MCGGYFTQQAMSVLRCSNPIVLMHSVISVLSSCFSHAFHLKNFLFTCLPFLQHAHALGHNAHIKCSMCLLPQTLCRHLHVSHKCTMFHCWRSQHKQIIGNKPFNCLKLFVVYKLVIFALMNSHRGKSVYLVSLREVSP